MFSCDTNPTVDLLIPVYKPGEELTQLLSKIKTQTYPVQTVHLLVTAAADEFTVIGRYLQREFGEGLDLKFTHVLPEEFDHGGTRHRGAAQSQAELLLFMTQDAVPADDMLVEHLVKAMTSQDGDSVMRSKGVAAVYARQLPAEDCHVLEQYTRQFNYPAESRIKTKEDLPVLGIKTYFCSNVCAAYRRDVYETLGGFEHRTIFNEDMIYAAGLIRAGYAIAYAADAKVIHSHNYSGLQQLHRNFDLAVSQAEHPEIFEGVPSEGEGIRMVKSSAAWLCKTGRIHLIPKLVWQSGCKYLGYRLGKNYRKLPEKLVLWLTMNRRYWK